MFSEEKLEIRNTKSEIRSPKFEENSKLETRKFRSAARFLIRGLSLSREIRASDFGFFPSEPESHPGRTVMAKSLPLPHRDAA